MLDTCYLLYIRLLLLKVLLQPILTDLLWPPNHTFGFLLARVAVLSLGWSLASSGGVTAIV